MIRHQPTIEIVNPFPVVDLPRVWLWLQEAGSSLLNDQGPQTMDDFVDDWMARKAIQWGVYRDGELGGWLAYEPLNETTGNVHCVFRKSFWGRKTTGPAIKQMFDELFEVGIVRIGMIVPEDNHAIISLIGWLGGEKEALWYAPRTVTGERLTRGGVPVSLVQYGLYREVWDEKQAEIGSGNHRPDGVSAAMAGRVVV